LGRKERRYRGWRLASIRREEEGVESRLKHLGGIGEGSRRRSKKPEEKSARGEVLVCY
jgi:hypothetical protein